MKDEQDVRQLSKNKKLEIEEMFTKEKEGRTRKKRIKMTEPAREKKNTQADRYV